MHKSSLTLSSRSCSILIASASAVLVAIVVGGAGINIAMVVGGLGGYRGSGAWVGGWLVA